MPSIEDATLARVCPDRLERGVHGFVHGAFAIELTRQTDTEICACVRSETGKDYDVTLTPDESRCSCADALYRGTTCKHVVGTALYSIRHPMF
jgi:uncharacterized Zn finger protein